MSIISILASTYVSAGSCAFFSDSAYGQFSSRQRVGSDKTIGVLDQGVGMSVYEACNGLIGSVAEDLRGAHGLVGPESDPTLSPDSRN